MRDSLWWFKDQKTNWNNLEFRFSCIRRFKGLTNTRVRVKGTIPLIFRTTFNSSFAQVPLRMRFAFSRGCLNRLEGPAVN